MKKGIHPEYREVVFMDVQSDFKFLTRSTMKSDEKIKWEDGKEYPLIKVEVSSASHPFYTGKKIFVDTAGRVEKFNLRYKKQEKNVPKKEEASAEEAKTKEAAPAKEEEAPVEEAKTKEAAPAKKEEASVEEAKTKEAAPAKEEEAPVEEAKTKEAAPAKEEEAPVEEAKAEAESREEITKSE